MFRHLRVPRGTKDHLVVAIARPRRANADHPPVAASQDDLNVHRPQLILTQCDRRVIPSGDRCRRRHVSQASGTVIDVTFPASTSPRTRGKNKQASWRRGDQATSTLVLSLDASDAHARTRLETLGWKAVAEDLGLTRNGFERLARAHALNSAWAMDHVSMALVYHMAAAVFEDAARHLWSDSSGKRHGALRVTSFYQFATIVGRARSHTAKTSGKPSASTAPSRATSTPTDTTISESTRR